ncbi:MAG: D-Ala-D-Ala carboxypeptidase family metallohydrolase [bacterium]
MKLSEHFTLSEFTVSQTASRYGYDNTPGEEEIAALRALCLNVLEPIRTQFGVPITISSGYRSLKVNKKVGGSSSSQHIKGEAADVQVWGYDPNTVFNWIAFYSGLDFDQVIQEFGSWVHVSFTQRRPNRRMALRARKSGGSTIYDRIYEPLDG